jgi:hypothetical protein
MVSFDGAPSFSRNSATDGGCFISYLRLGKPTIEEAGCQAVFCAWPIVGD